MGFDLNLLVDHSVDDHFLCHICCGVVERPTTVAKCQHIFCESCVEEWLLTRDCCPVHDCLNTDLTLGNVSDAYFEQYCKIKVKCMNIAMGCNQVFEIDHIQSHLETCQYSKDNYFDCQCGQLVNKQDWAHNCIDHLKSEVSRLKSSKSKLEAIKRQLEVRLKEKSDECQRLRTRLPANRQLSATSPELQDIVEVLKELSIVTTSEVERTLLSVDRRLFCPQNPYNDYKTDIGFGAEFNSPVIDAIILEAVRSHSVVGARVLDIGCGTGYLSVCLADLCDNQCSVVAIDHIPELVETAKQNVKTIFGVNYSAIEFRVGDGRLGCPELGPYDVIIVEGFLDKVDDEGLLDQLKVGGRMCAAVALEDQTESQSLQVVDRLSESSTHRQNLTKVSLKAITDREVQLLGYSNED